MARSETMSATTMVNSRSAFLDQKISVAAALLSFAVS
jgi:hypothetical protein